MRIALALPFLLLAACGQDDEMATIGNDADVVANTVGVSADVTAIDAATDSDAGLPMPEVENEGE
ncbi:hypothetical protein [Sphingomicrobium lutaoense]|uniref:Uncharacterized protein n=1 Tax=Sphingomicrobium lutaoense TaxID=515949 RepID=A0A839YUS5_9SPHN|nr:hypothetical protein [Sphingomicrobium lutaoense]MBB3763981.1 hypothetical protein [Sphingomicrobium lutaoense]